MKKKLLLVFFEAFKLKEIKNLLEEEGFQVVIAFDGAEGYEMFKNEKPDLVITGANLPRIHGFELCQRIRTESQMKIPVIVVGTHKGKEFKNEAVAKCNATAFFEYPFDRREFLNIVKDSLYSKEEELFRTIPIKADRREFLKDSAGERKFTSEELFGRILEELENPTKDERKVEKSEEDLDKRLEETLSGLGIKVRVKPSTETKKEKLSHEFPEKERPSKVLEEKGKEGLPTVGIPPILPEEVEKIKGEIPVKETIGDYILEEKIATGGMAELFKAKRKGVEGFEKTVVVKRILHSAAEDREFIDMLIDEAKIASQLSHPNIVQIFDLGKKEDFYFIAMEYVNGKDLRTILKTLSFREKLLPFEISAYVVMKVCDALYYAHNKKDNRGKPLKIVHRDVSPHNILISYDGDVKLTDFGVAKASTMLHKTVVGQIKGKMLYMSPEQSKGSKEVDFRSDIYSLGCVLFEMITGKKLFMADSEMAVLEKVKKGQIVKPTKLNPEIPVQLENIVLKALKQRPSERYQSALEMKKDLEDFIVSRRKTIPDNHELSLLMSELFPGEFDFLPPAKGKAEIREIERESPQIFKAFYEKERKIRGLKPLIFPLILTVLLLMGYLAYNFLYIPRSKRSPETEITKEIQEQIVGEKVKVEEVKVPPLKEGDLLSLEEVDVRPSAIKKLSPRLTFSAERASAHGEILLDVLISETGDVLDVKLVKGVSKTLGMNEEAMKAVREWKFSPAIKSGKRVRVWMPVVLKF